MASDGPHEPPIPPREDTQPIPIAPPNAVPPPQEPPPNAVPPPEEPPPDVTPVAAVRPPAAGPSRAVIIAALAVVLILGIALVLNLVVARQAQSRAEEHALAAIGAPVDVDLRGFPVGLRILTGGRLDARVRARDVPLEGTDAILSSLVIILDDVRLDREGDGAIEALHAQFTAELDDDAVQQLIGLPGRIPLADVELGSGIARFSIARFPVLDATAAIEDGQVVFRLTAPIANLLNVRLQLDDLPMGFRADSVEIRRDVLRLEGSAVNLRLEG